MPQLNVALSSDYAIPSGRVSAPPTIIVPSLPVLTGFEGKIDQPVPPGAVNHTGQCGHAKKDGRHDGKFYTAAVDRCTRMLLTSRKTFRVVEIGCGEAKFSAVMAGKGAEVTSIDCHNNLGAAAQALLCAPNERAKPGKIKSIQASAENTTHKDYPWLAKFYFGEKFGHWLPDRDLDTVVRIMTERADDGAVAMFSLASFDCDFVKGRFYQREIKAPGGITKIRVKMPVTPSTPIDLRHVAAEPSTTGKPRHFENPVTPRTWKEARGLFEKRGWNVDIKHSPTWLFELTCTYNRPKSYCYSNLVDLFKARQARNDR